MGSIAWLRVSLFALLPVLLLLQSNAEAHPSHSSYAEVEWGPESSLDVALKVIPEDLERALSQTAGKRVPLLDRPEVRELLTLYLQRHFRLSSTDGPLQLVGMELAYRDTWIYFSLPATRDPQLLLENTLLMDLEPTQTNRVKRLWAPEAPVLLFTAAEPRRRLAVP